MVTLLTTKGKLYHRQVDECSDHTFLKHIYSQSVHHLSHSGTGGPVHPSGQQRTTSRSITWILSR